MLFISREECLLASLHKRKQGLPGAHVCSGLTSLAHVTCIWGCIYSAYDASKHFWVTQMFVLAKLNMKHLVHSSTGECKRSEIAHELMEWGGLPSKKWSSIKACGTSQGVDNASKIPSIRGVFQNSGDTSHLCRVALGDCEGSPT